MMKEVLFIVVVDAHGKKRRASKHAFFQLFLRFVCSCYNNFIFLDSKARDESSDEKSS